MRVLLIDHYDSFTFNLRQQIARVGGGAPLVVPHDAITLGEIEALGVDAIVLSPGPGHPGREGDFRVSRAVIAAERWPVLGVCLGFQGIARHWGAAVERAEPVHGQWSEVFHDGEDLFRGLPQGLRAVRYHSLAVVGKLPAELECTAWTADGLPMGLRHRSLPYHGLQFHPESIATEHGDEMVARFLEGVGRKSPLAPLLQRGGPEGAQREGLEGARRGGSEVRFRRLEVEVDPERVFVELFAGLDYAFWLDSSLRRTPDGRFSFLGGARRADATVMRYDVAGGVLEIERGGERTVRRESVFAYLARALSEGGGWEPGLPFDFQGGFVGYFGYELKAECGGRSAHRSDLPDATFFYADRLVVFDHETGAVYLVALTRDGDGSAAERWLAETAARLETLAAGGPASAGADAGTADADDAGFRPRRSRARYLRDVEACLEKIRAGESYQVCLTQTLEAAPVTDPLVVYRALRASNPAPYAAFLQLGEVAILSSSPERFLRVDRDRVASARPIKGTAPRGADPDDDARLRDGLAASVKNRAENLMIVDLLRHDLGRVCELGSVEVPSLMAVETYATVHQLVSTVRGRLRDDRDAVDAVRACFPPGSMTGAPKIRTMTILDEIEGHPRGIYSGALGYLSFGGTADLAVVIRTLVATPERSSIGSGGAIVALSDPEAEWREMRHKARALERAVATASAAAASVARVRALRLDDVAS